jgi:hypothetical protein
MMLRSLQAPCGRGQLLSSPKQSARSLHVARVASTGVSEVTQLLETLTQPDMSIAELHLEMGDLEIRVRRSVEADVPLGAAAVAPAVPSMMSAVVIAPEPHMQPALHLAPMPYVRWDWGAASCCSSIACGGGAGWGCCGSPVLL